MNRETFESLAKEFWPEVDLSTEPSQTSIDGTTYRNTNTKWMYVGWQMAQIAASRKELLNRI